MIVMKFGGSSVESAIAIRRVASIVNSHLDLKPTVVVSAMGKTTDRLLAIANFCVAGNQQAAFRELARLREFHMREAAAVVTADQAFSIDRVISAHFTELEELLTDVMHIGILPPRLSDAIVSFGERLSSHIMTAALRRAGIDAVHLDARSVIVTDNRHTCATLLPVETNALLRRKVSQEQVTVMGGFIGATENGIPTTLGRGGSDYSAAIVGAAIGADEIQIWTDVDGMLTCDPRIVPEAHCLRSTSYAQAEEMANCGAKVLHPATVLPAIKQRIPIVIRNSRNPNAAGTRITEEAPALEGMMSIACRSDVTLLQVRPRNSPVTPDFGRTIWDAFAGAGVRFELISPAVKQFSLVVATSSLTPAFRKQIEAQADVTYDENRALITLIGNNGTRNAVMAARAAERLRSLDGGAIPTSCTDSRFGFVVDAASLRAAALELHKEFFSTPDPALFVPDRSDESRMVHNASAVSRAAQPSLRAI